MYLHQVQFNLVEWKMSSQLYQNRHLKKILTIFFFPYFIQLLLFGFTTFSILYNIGMTFCDTDITSHSHVLLTCL